MGQGGRGKSPVLRACPPPSPFWGHLLVPLSLRGHQVAGGWHSTLCFPAESQLCRETLPVLVINPFPSGAVKRGPPIPLRASSGGPMALSPQARAAGKGSGRRWPVTLKFHPGLAGAGPSPKAWPAGALHLQTPVPAQMPIPPCGTGSTGLSSPSTSPGCHPSGCLYAGLGDTGWLQAWWALHSTAPSPGTPRGHCAGSGQLGLRTKRAAALPRSSLRC